MLAIASAALLLSLLTANTPGQAQDDADQPPPRGPIEQYGDPPAPPRPRQTCPPLPPEDLRVGGFQSVQVNVDANGDNIVGDAANEPSLTIDPINPNRLAIAWRQFDSIDSNFRQAGRAYSTDAGRSWVFPGVLTPGTFRSDPVLAADANGFFYYFSLQSDYDCDLFTSADAGITWDGPIPAWGGDKAWMDVDRTAGMGRGNGYFAWDYAGCCGDRVFMRTADQGAHFTEPVVIPEFPIWGTVAIGPDGAVYVVGRAEDNSSHFYLAHSSNAQDSGQTPAFDFASEVNLNGRLLYMIADGPNPGGLLGQVWVACDHSETPRRGNVYVLCSVDPPGGGDPLELMFNSSSDSGRTWGDPVRVNDDRVGNGAWQWFGTLAVAPSGRLDAAWYDTRNTGEARRSEVFYSYSIDGGATWSANMPVTPQFDSWIGWPNQNKLGDYIHAVSDDGGMNLAYAATYNGEQDVYFVRIAPDCNGNGIHDGDDIAYGHSFDANGNGVPDECETDCAAISKFRASCRTGTLRAKVRSTLPEGTLLHVDNNGDVQPMTIAADGRGKVRWTGQTGPHTVTLNECPEHTRDVACN